MKRWYNTHESTRPATVAKNQSDREDLDFLFQWLFLHDMKVDFELYKGTEKPELLKRVRAYYDSCRNDAESAEALQGVLHEEDWDTIHVTQRVDFRSELGLTSEP